MRIAKAGGGTGMDLAEAPREPRCGTERISSSTGEGELGMGELNTARERPGPHWLHATEIGLTQG
jgi:hypothetical protein